MDEEFQIHNWAKLKCVCWLEKKFSMSSSLSWIIGGISLHSLLEHIYERDAAEWTHAGEEQKW